MGLGCNSCRHSRPSNCPHVYPLICPSGTETTIVVLGKPQITRGTAPDGRAGKLHRWKVTQRTVRSANDTYMKTDQVEEPESGDLRCCDWRVRDGDPTRKDIGSPPLVSEHQWKTHSYGKVLRSKSLPDDQVWLVDLRGGALQAAGEGS